MGGDSPPTIGVVGSGSWQIGFEQVGQVSGLGEQSYLEVI